MNPTACLGGGGGSSSSPLHYVVDNDDVVDAVAASDLSSQAESSSGGTKGSGGSNNANASNGRSSRQTPRNSRGGSSSLVSCMGPAHCSSRYHPDDSDEPLPLPSNPADVVLHSLNGTVPELLARISSSPPTTFPEGTSPYEMRRAVREFDARRTVALQRLHDLTIKGKEHNRAPLVRNKEGWDVIGALSAALLASASAGENSKTTIDGNMTRQQQSKAKKNADDDRRLICWTINNLSVPYENKEAIALGEHSATLLQALTMVIKANMPETYLCCICLLNLTFLADAIRPVTFYVPSSYGGGMPPYSSPPRSRSAVFGHNNNGPAGGGGRPPTSPLSRSRSLHPARSRSSTLGAKNNWMSEQLEGRISDVCGMVLGNSSSLLRVVERMMLANAPFLLSSVQSAQGQAVRWTCGFVRNITYAGEADAMDGGRSHGRRGWISDDSVEEICTLVSATEIPRLLVQFVNDSPRTTLKWTKDSLEDLCMGAMCNMAQFQASREALKRAGAVRCLEKIEGLPGIHGYRARAIRCSLGELPVRTG